MKCQFCDKPATEHLTKLVNHHQKVLHLCADCAEQQHLLPKAGQKLNLQAVLHLMIGQHVSPVTEELARLTCPVCGIKYMEFRANGRLGCPADYEVFRAGLDALLQRIHRAVRHAGKRPKHPARPSVPSAERLELQRRLQLAVLAERYEEAARLRDQIRRKGASDESG